MIRIDELHIQAPGRNPEDGNALGKQLSERLAETIPEPKGNVHIPEIRVRLQISSSDSITQTAHRIAEQIIGNINLETL